MRRIGTSAVLVFICLTISICGSWPVHAQQSDTESETAEQAEQAPGSGEASVEKLEDVVVTGKRGTPGLETRPSKTIIEVDDFSVIGPTSNIQDLLKTQAIIDFRGATDLVPDSDTLTMRGFDSKRFVVAVDGLTVQKTGGRKGSHIVDYSLLSSLPIEKIEIIAGPHSALFDSKSIGGVVNVMTRPPKRRDTLKPDAKLSASYGSYDTQNYKLNLNGAVHMVTYGVGVNKNTTDGYLRNTKTDIETYSGALGLLLPYEGYINVSSTISDIDRQAAVTNTEADYDSDYPEVKKASFDPWQDPTWDKETWAYRLDYLQNLPIGRLSLGAYNSKEDRKRAYYDYIDEDDPSLGMELKSMYTRWRQKGGKLQDDYQWSENHASTLGVDYVKLYDGEDMDERVEKTGAYFQHQWNITSYLDTKLGVRYEDVTIWVSNSQRPDRGITYLGPWIERKWEGWIPKSYTTLKMDPLAGWLRDTSLSLGISKIWHAPDSHGDYNPQGRPTGAWLEPEHGMGYDLVLNRRLWRDISLMVDYSFYRIKDYIASNSSFAEEHDISDYKINLEEVHRHGVELSLGGHLLDDLSFYLTWAWQKYDNQGDELAGKGALDDQAENRVTAGLRYQLFDSTAVKLDYYHQSEESLQEHDNIGTDKDPVYVFWEVDNPAYNLFHFAVEQTLFRDKWHMKDARLQFYIKNLFDEEYYDSRAYPATDRTFGVTLNARI